MKLKLLKYEIQSRVWDLNPTYPIIEIKSFFYLRAKMRRGARYNYCPAKQIAILYLR